jgi:hypothetical protein
VEHPAESRHAEDAGHGGPALLKRRGRGTAGAGARHCHSIVAGGLLEVSYATRLMPGTSLMIRVLTVDSTS